MFSILKLRLLVGFLGERAQYAWWPTAFCEPSGRLFLEPIFAKTGHLAQYHGLTEAARHHHDEALSVSAFHLFHLPEEVEQDLHKLMLEHAAPAAEISRYDSAYAALDALTELSDGKVSQALGPIAIGQVSDVANHLSDIAAVYASAFGSGTQAIPYLVRDL
ncbi:MAG: BrxE family protein [Alphaproteobacteria bacterium]|nr:MAG: BrxE family protein [Alphaproteobacteria bacterium]